MTKERVKFDQFFEAILDRNGSEPSVRRTPTVQAADQEERLRAAAVLFHGGQYVRCLSLLRGLRDEMPQDARVQAFSGACRALVLGEHRQGLEACVSAVRRAFYFPDVYCALGLVLLRLGDRARAFAAFQRGLRIDPRNKALRARLREMGLRRTPVLPFLPRGHHANRLLGRLRARLFPA